MSAGDCRERDRGGGVISLCREARGVEAVLSRFASPPFEPGDSLARLEGRSITGRNPLARRPGCLSEEKVRVDVDCLRGRLGELRVTPVTTRHAIQYLRKLQKHSALLRLGVDLGLGIDEMR